MDLTAQDNWLIVRRKQIAVLEKLAILIALLFSQAIAQGKPEDRVTLSIKNGTLESVLKEIRKQTGYNYALQDRWKAMAKPVDIFVKDVPVEQALGLCFKDQPFTYTIISRTIVIEERKPVEPKEPIGAAGTKPPDGISGVVLSDEGIPLLGATIEIKELSKRQLADEHGAFFFSGISAGKYDLQVSFVGYDEFRATVTFKEEPIRLRVNMKRGGGNLDEVQIIGYGTTTRRLNTGNVTTVKSGDLDKQPVGDAMLALEGRVPGMEITQATGLPGSSIQVQIRGINTIASGVAPLFIVDGVPYPATTLTGVASNFLLGDASSGSPFNLLSPSDIESIDVLKDAAATAIYGSQGANGVVLITTKKGKAGQSRVDITAQNGIGKDAERLKLLNTRQYLEMRHEAFQNDNALPNPSSDYDVTFWDTTRNTDWQKALLGGNAKYTDVQGSVSGGSINTQYLLSGVYHKETTVFPGSYYDQKGSGHIAISNTSPNKKFKVSFTGTYLVDNNLTSAMPIAQSAIELAPDAPAMFNKDGSINWEPNAVGVSTWPSNQGNPSASMLTNYNNSTNNLMTNAVVSYDFLKGFAFKTSMGYNNMQVSQYFAVPFAALDPSTWSYSQRRSQFGNNVIQSWIIEPQITYSGRLANGVLSALVGTTIQENKTVATAYAATGFNSDQVMENPGAATTITPGTIINAIYKYNAGFGRVNYNLEDKYIMEFSGRRDGSSRFGPANEFHDFFAIGTGWLFYKEHFIQKHFPVLSFGKFRLSYGTTGNDQVGDYSYLDLYNYLPNISMPYQGAQGLVPLSLFNPDLAWEDTKKIEGGIELGFLKDRIFFTISHYQNVSSNLLLGNSLPDITGFPAVEKNLPAKIQNNGWEGEVKTINIVSKNFSWSTSFNISMNRNQITSGGVGLSENLARLIGHSLNSIYVYHCLGVNPITGVYQFSDSHGSPTYNPNPSTDENTLVDVTTKFHGGIDNVFKYKSIEVDFFFQFARRPKEPLYLFDGVPGYYSSIQGQNQPTTVLSRWRKPGDVSNIEKFSQDLNLENAYKDVSNSDLVYGDGSFVRLKNVSLSWSLPKSWSSGAHLQNASIFVHGQNLLLITHYKGLDPETLNANLLPPLRVITFGARVGL